MLLGYNDYISLYVLAREGGRNLPAQSKLDYDRLLSYGVSPEVAKKYSKFGNDGNVRKGLSKGFNSPQAYTAMLRETNEKLKRSDGVNPADNASNKLKLIIRPEYPAGTPNDKKFYWPIQVYRHWPIHTLRFACSFGVSTVYQPFNFDYKQAYNTGELGKAAIIFASKQQYLGSKVKFIKGLDGNKKVVDKYRNKSIKVSDIIYPGKYDYNLGSRTFDNLSFKNLDIIEISGIPFETLWFNAKPIKGDPLEIGPIKFADESLDTPVQMGSLDFSCWGRKWSSSLVGGSKFSKYHEIRVKKVAKEKKEKQISKLEKKAKKAATKKDIKKKKIY